MNHDTLFGPVGVYLRGGRSRQETHVSITAIVSFGYRAVRLSCN